MKLPKEHDGSSAEYAELSDIALQQLRNELGNVKLFIIDEISMVSNSMLLFIHLRLQEIYNSFQKDDGWFGGINILLFGDLLQLPPVTPNCPFVTIPAARVSQIRPSMACDINLWKDLFSYDELTINVRQQSDRSYANILSRIRLGIVDEYDQEELEGRLLHFSTNNDQEGYLQELINQLKSLPTTCVCLFATRNQCAELNRAMLTLLPGEEIILKCKDKFDGRDTLQRQKAQEYLRKLSENNNNTAALEDTLTVKIGCKVMLRRNISSTLVNGSIGTLMEIIKDGMDGSVSKMKIQFGDVEHLLERLDVKFQVYTNVYVVQSQFPVALAYGITIHKSQSLSLECCLMDLGNSIFSAGQTYVALSRVTSLNGLYLVNYDPSKVVVNTQAIYEYNRLRSIYRPDLKEIAITENNSSKRKDIVWWKQGYVEADPIDNSDRAVVSLPGFKNENNNCFANAALQCLLGIASINRNIMLSQDSSLKRLTAQYNNPNNVILNSDEIITDVGFQLGRMQDATEFITLLAQSFPNIRNEIQFTLGEIRRCSNCSYQYEFKYDRPEQHLHEIFNVALPTAAEATSLLRQSSKKNAKTLSMAHLLRHSYAPKLMESFKCCRCDRQNTTTHTITITEAGNVVAIALNIFVYTSNSYSRLPLKLSAVPATTLTIAGSQYKLKSCIFHHGESANAGHYTAYTSVNNGWYFLDDSNVRLKRWPQLARNAYILFYQKVTR